MRVILVASLLIISIVSGCTEKSSDIDNKSIPPEYSPVVDIAKNDLAERLNISVEEIQLVNLEKVNWPDTSLGYPEKGMMYAQVITPGFKILLKAGGKLYEYHSDYERVVGPKEVSY